ncbi:MAG: aminopeptidase [Oceanicoccus sp.]|jgi:aminopeptidase
MNTSLLERFTQITKVVLEKQMQSKDEPTVLLFDRQCDLASLLADAYSVNMPQAEKLNFDDENPDELREKLLNLPSGATVVMIQSSNFRLDDFRIRLQLFNAGIGCLEHAHLKYFGPDEHETYANALEYRGEYYQSLGESLAEKLEHAKEVKVVSKNGSILRFGSMEKCKINHGIFWKQKNRGGAAICGEIFTEAKDFSSVNGELMIAAYPGMDWKMVSCEPFKVKIVKSILTCDDPKCPPLFRENILDVIAASEDGEVMIREAGFGMNPAISHANPLSDVSAFERMAGFHLSIGKKHPMYRKKLNKAVVQRYHIDVFADLEQISIDNEVVYQAGAYVIDSPTNLPPAHAA